VIQGYLHRYLAAKVPIVKEEIVVEKTPKLSKSMVGNYIKGNAKVGK